MKENVNIQENKKWHKKKWGVAVVVLFFPVFLLFFSIRFLLGSTRLDNSQKAAIITLLIFVLLVIFSFGFDSSDRTLVQEDEFKQMYEACQTRRDQVLAENEQCKQELAKYKSESKEDEITDISQPEIPSYEIVMENSTRFDGAISYFVVLTNFEKEYQNVHDNARLVIADVITKNENKASVRVFASYEALDAYVRKYDTDSICVNSCLREVNQTLETGLIASYTGYLETAASNHELSFFPSAFSDHETVGEYVGFEDFVAEEYLVL